MGRRAAKFWHATSSVAAGVLYFFFVLPRWPELMGDTSHALGTVARIIAGVVIALAALPVVFTLLELRKPEFGTPALALTLRTWSVVAHVIAGVLIVGTAISEIWLNLDSVGQWL
jgi:predicted CDP-diglyceride synthetase/phosphatidate cytidylyltransferase